MPRGKKKKASKPTAKSKPGLARKKKQVKPRKPSGQPGAMSNDEDDKYRILVENSPVCIHEIDMDGNFMWMNAVGLAMMNVKDESEIIGTAYLDAVCDKDRGRIKKLLGRAYKGHSSHFEFVSSGAKPCIFSSCFIPIKNNSGKVVRLMGITEDITERKRAEDRMRLVVEGTTEKVGEDFFRNLVKHLAQALEVNYAFIAEIADAKGARARTISMWDGIDHIPNFEYDTKDTPCEKVIGKKICRYPSNAQTLFPKDKWLKDAGIESYMAIPLFDQQGRPVGHMGIMDDKPMTEEKEVESILRIFAARAGAELNRMVSEKALKLSEEKYRYIFEKSSDAIIITGADGRLLDFNDYALELFGYTEKEMRGMNSSALYADLNDRARLRQEIEEKGFIRDFEVKYRKKDGAVMECLLTATLRRADDGSVIEYQGIMRDVTERKKAEEALRESEELFSALAHSSPVGIFRTDHDGNCIYVNPLWRQIAGLTNEEARGEGWLKALHPDDRDRIINEWYKAAEENRPFRSEYRFVSPDGKVKWLDGQAVAEKDNKGNISGYIGTITDITERKLAEEALKDALEFGRKIIAKSPVGIAIYDESGQCVDVNESIAEIVGATKKQMLQQNYHYIESWKKSGLYEKAVSAIGDNSVKRHDARIKTTFGKDLTLDCFIVPFMSAGKRQLLVMANDITEKKKTEEELIKAKEKAEEATKEKDQYISLIAHDLKSPFTSIVTLLELLSREKDDPIIAKHRMLIDAAHDTSEHAVKVIDDVLHASRFESGKIELNPGFMDGNIEAFSVIATHGHLAREKGIELVNEVPENTRLYADHSLFREVLINLAYNAIKFCEKGDTITFYVPMGELSTIAVKDTGAGMNEYTAANVFRQDVKTTSPGTAGERGTGIGLPFCAGIMKEHGGELTAESVEGKGSVFYARLPYVKPTALIVDDDAVVLYLMRDQLGKIGASVIEAKNEKEIFTALEEDSPHLIFLDLHLPGVDGMKILKKVKADKNTRNIPVIIVTSDDRIETREKAMRLGADDFISKPIKPEELIPRARMFIS